MTNEYVLDAHALVWFLEGNPNLGANARAAMQDPASVLYLPVIALAEACWVIEHGRTSIPSVASFLNDIDADPRIVLVPLDRAILALSLSLTPISEMHDRQIVSTTLHLAAKTASPVSLLSCDHDIIASGVVPIIW
jgi:PIN domain nuclease of toxin-antitoxin system